MAEANAAMFRNTKACPRCGAKLFEDMDVCYGCLFDFSTGDEAVADGGIRAHTLGTGGGSCLNSGTARRGGALSVAPTSSTCGPPGGMVREREPDDLDEPWGDGDAARRGEGSARVLTQPGAGTVRSAARAGGSAAGAPAAPSGPVPLDGRDPKPSGDTRTVMLCASEAASTHRLRLRVISPEVSVICEVPDEGVSIGRDPDNLVIVTSQAVSRHHLRLIPEATWLVAQDLGATNPPLLNGKQLCGGMRMHEGDVLELRAAGVTVRACA